MNPVANLHRRHRDLTARVLAHLGVGCRNLAVVFGAPLDPRSGTGPAGTSDTTRPPARPR